MKFLPVKLTERVGKIALKAQKHSPTILFGAGAVGVVVTAVLASRATLKLENVLVEHEIQNNNILEDDHPDYTDNERKRDQVVLFARTTGKIVKLYAPTAISASASIGALAGSHIILNRRNAAIAAAYTAVDKAFREYRERVREDAGVEKDREYLYGSKTELVKAKTKSGKDGIKGAVTPTTAPGPYGRLYNEFNSNWQPIPMHNLLFLQGVQSHCNDQLQRKGWLLLNDAYDALGFERTKEGCVVGWLKDGDGDGYVDFGIYDGGELVIFEFVTGKEGEIYLDFNVDGLIQDKI